MSAGWLEIAAGGALIVLVLWDTFETMILPRSVTSPIRLAFLVNRTVWRAWRAIVFGLASVRRHERYLGFYGPLSVLLMLVLWAVALIAGFAVIGVGLGSRWVAPEGAATFKTALYVSGTTFFTLGLGDVHPVGTWTRALVVAESGTGFGFLAIGISYLPVLYQSFSRREVQITLLDAWAGSPPSAVELLRRLSAAGAVGSVHGFLKEWERWSSEVLEGHISYPQVAYFRSQHGKQSWVASLTAVLDVSALVLTGIRGLPEWQARVTFAIARHAAVDLGQILHAPPIESARMTADACDRLIAAVEGAGLQFEHDDAPRRLLRFRNLYEPYVAGLAAELAMELPPWIRDGAGRDNWEATPKTRVEVHL
ncbi:MAG TPA: potassium channel family protein [Vicinamibacterales bacterium]|nr:potassium channel family protein [Vicinamibacterales bacterium]